MSAPKPPAPPDPKETAAAQTGTNVSTAVANSYLNNVNQNTPYGSLTYDVTGMQTVTDGATGKKYQVPTWTATQKLSEEQQAIQDQLTGAQTNLATLANDQSAFLNDYMKEPFSYDVGEHEAWASDLYNKLNSEDLANQQESMRSQLANQGIKVGSEAYDRSMEGLMTSQGNARNRFMLDSYNTGMNTALTTRNQPINEISALMGGSQITQPSYAQTYNANIPTTDYAGIVSDNYNQRLNIWQQQNAQRQGMLGGLLGFGGSIFGALSDERAKKNIKEVGELQGHKLYQYDYKKETGIPGKHIGVMAQKVEKKRPDAVNMGPDGLRRVDYGKLFGAGRAA